MIDPAALGSLLVEVFGAAKDWREPKIAQFDPPEDIEKEEVVRDLKAKGHKLQWVLKHRLRQLERDGWTPVVERDLFGRPTVFMDRRSELILVHRAPDSRAGKVAQ